MRWLLLVFVVACSKGSAPAPAPSPGSAAPSANVAPTLPIDANLATVDAARVVPKVDTACQTSADCSVTSDTLEDDPPRTYACCPGCSQTAVSSNSIGAFQQWCRVNPAPMCPPIGCAMPEMRASCEAGHCVAKGARTVPKPDIPATP